MNDDQSSYMQLAQRLTREVGARIRDILNSREEFSVNYKSRRDLVTEVDVWSEEVIANGIFGAYPKHVLIGEETSARMSEDLGLSLEEIAKSGVCWVVDPLDGTTNFASRIPHVGVSIAVLVDGVRQVGVVYDPVRDEMFHAIRGEGAFLNDVRIEVTNKTDMVDCVVATGFPVDRCANWEQYRPAHEVFIKNSRCIRRFGAATLDFCWVACGRFDGFFEYKLKPWDVAAGSLIVEEAGGMVGNFAYPDDRRDRGFTVFGKSYLASGSIIYPRMFSLATNAHQGSVSEEMPPE